MTQDGNLVLVFFLMKRQMANVMLELLDGFHFDTSPDVTAFT